MNLVPEDYIIYFIHIRACNISLRLFRLCLHGSNTTIDITWSCGLNENIMEIGLKDNHEICAIIQLTASWVVQTFVATSRQKCDKIVLGMWTIRFFSNFQSNPEYGTIGSCSELHLTDRMVQWCYNHIPLIPANSTTERIICVVSHSLSTHARPNERMHDTQVASD